MKLPLKFVYKSNENFIFISLSIVIFEHHRIWKLCLKFCRWVWQIHLEPTAVCNSNCPVASTAVLSKVTRVECFVRKCHVFIEKSDFCRYRALRPTFRPAPTKPSCSTFHSSFSEFEDSYLNRKDGPEPSMKIKHNFGVKILSCWTISSNFR